MNKQEDFQNRALAELLTERGIPADYEQRGWTRKMDVVAEVDGLRVVPEAETGFHRKALGHIGMDYAPPREVGGRATVGQLMVSLSIPISQSTPKSAVLPRR